AGVAGGEPGEHPVHPFGLFRPGELVGNQDHDALAVAVGRHRTTPALAAPDLHHGFRLPHTGTLTRSGGRSHPHRRHPARDPPRHRPAGSLRTFHHWLLV